jgi:hypothetical protein
MHGFQRKLTVVSFLIVLSSCSSNNGLRKFDEKDLDKATSVDLAKKFEVKDVGDSTTAPAPTPVLLGELPKMKQKVKKKKHSKAEVQAVTEATPTPALTPPSRRKDPMPFEIGENLEYGIRYVGVTAGYFNLTLLPLKQLNDRKVFHIQANVKTVKLFELVYRVNDVVESFWDYDGLYSHKFTMDLDESKQNRKLIELYDYEKKESYYWNRVDHVEKGFSEKKEHYDIELWSQDPISMLYYLRVLNLPKDPAVETKVSFILDGKPWVGALRFLKKENIYAGGKNRDANAYSMVNSQNGEVKNKDNTVWISDDEHRYILRVETKVKVGSFAVVLDKVL